MPYKNPEQARSAARVRKARFRRRRHAERFGPNAGDMRGRHGNHARGERNGRWNPGRLLSSHGYVLVRVPKDHHRAFGNGYAYEHDLVTEVNLGRPLKPSEVVHHRNEVKTDNRPENLELLTASDHMRLHDAMRERDEDGRFLRVRDYPATVREPVEVGA